MKYRHLSLEEREILYGLREQSLSFREIARRLKRSHTTLSREYRRNAPYLHTHYLPIRAHKRFLKRSSRQRKKAPLKSPEILLLVREGLRKGWSPEIISGRLKLEKGLKIDPETVYRYIYRKENRKEHLEQYLTLKRRSRMKVGNPRPRRLSRIENAISIEQRPHIVQKRKEVGHWETDLMHGKNRKALLVNVERVSRYVVITRIPNKKALTTSSNMIRVLKRFNPITITSDNGLENSRHQQVSQRLNTHYYFCHPYSSFEKGSVENRIGVIRRYIPKRVDLIHYSHRQIKILQEKLNRRPMKCLGFLTPEEFLRKEGFMV